MANDPYDNRGLAWSDPNVVGWPRTEIVTTMDPNGLFYIQSKVPD